MNEYLQENKRVIRAFVRAHWSDQKLHDVYAFNRDGRMTFQNSCACILGVTGSDVLHDDVQICPESHEDPFGSVTGHYSRLRKTLPGACEAEVAYQQLGYRVIFKSSVVCEIQQTSGDDNIITRQNILSAILRAEIRRRSRATAPASAPEEVLCSNSI